MNGKMMLLFDNALKIVLDSAGSLGCETVDINRAVNRVLAEDVKSDIDMPPSDRAVMDGYACRRQDLVNELTIIEIVPAGKEPEKEIGPNKCAKIMTGAVMPRGADCVVMVEFTENPTENTVRFFGDDSNDYIRRKGADLKAGQVVLSKGIIIQPRHIAVLAAAGHTEVLVSKRPKVGIIATGDELVEPQVVPTSLQIRNSNSSQLIAQLESVGAKATYYGITKDSINDLDRVFKKAASENDIVTLSGGVSMGDFDFVPDVLKQNKIKLLFEKIALKPGKPTVFGMRENLYCFGIPGNPVSTYVVFELMMKPFLYKLMSHDYSPLHIEMPLAENLHRKDTERLGWFPVKITGDGKLKPLEYHGSAHINALSEADGLVSMDIGVSEIPKGSVIPVKLI
jgi:molybdopterin molybdotransferase